MGLRYFIFIFLIIFIAVFPLTQLKKIKKEFKQKNLIPLIIYDSKFKVFDKNLSKKGKFSKLIVDKNFTAYNLLLEDITKNYTINSKKSIYSKNVLYNYEIKYLTNEYNLSTNFAKFNTITKLIEGKNFLLTSLKYRAIGDSFRVDKDKNIFATNIQYFIKVNE